MKRTTSFLISLVFASASFGATNVQTNTIGGNLTAGFSTGPNTIDASSGNILGAQSLYKASSNTVYDLIKIQCDATLATNLVTFPDTTVGWSASPAYVDVFIADVWLAMTNYPAAFTNAQVQNIYKKFLAGVDGSGNFPISLYTNGTAHLYYAGTDTLHNRTTGDPIWCIPLLALDYYNRTGSTTGLASDLALMDTAMQSVPRNGSTHLVSAGTNSGTYWVTWGFNDNVKKGGDDLMASLFYWRAAKAMSTLYTAVGNSTKATAYTADAALIAANIDTLKDSGTGMYYAASVTNHQLDIPSSAIAVYLGLASSPSSISSYLVTNVNSVFNSSGFNRNSPTDWSVEWISPPSVYDNGYWSWASAWVLYTVAQTNPDLAIRLASRQANSAGILNEYHSGDSFSGVSNNLESPMGALNYLNSLSSSAIHRGITNDSDSTTETRVSSEVAGNSKVGGCTTTRTLNSTREIIVGDNQSTTNLISINRHVDGTIINSAIPAYSIYADGTNLNIARYTGAGVFDGQMVIGAGAALTLQNYLAQTIFNVDSGGTISTPSVTALLVGNDDQVRWGTDMSSIGAYFNVAGDALKFYRINDGATLFSINRATGAGAFGGPVTGSNLSGTNTGDQTSVSGNAGTATALQTARTINGTSFDGTANINCTDEFTTVSTPTTGSTLTGSATVGTELLEIEPAGTIAALTINLESADALPIGTVKQIAMSQVITTLTIAPSGAGGGSINGTAVTAGVVNGSYAFKKTASKTWRRLY